MLDLKNGAKQIELHLPAAAIVFRHTLHQCRLAVLDSAADWKNSVTTLGRGPGRLEYVSTFFSNYAASRIPLCPRFNQMAEPAGTGSSALICDTADCDLPFPVPSARTSSNHFTTANPYPLAA
jgi:hypothetical protein